jgi:hypothetical protein
MSNNPSKWSDGLIALTREAIGNLSIDTKGLLHFKNLDGRSGTISWRSLNQGNLVIEDKATGQHTSYCSADELLQAGWAID